MIKVKKRKILLLPGDGIGPEVIDEVKKIINNIIPFVSVDAIVGSTMSLQLAREANIQSAPNTEGLGIQSL